MKIKVKDYNLLEGLQLASKIVGSKRVTPYVSTDSTYIAGCNNTYIGIMGDLSYAKSCIVHDLDNEMLSSVK